MKNGNNMISQRFINACNALAEAVNKQLFDGRREWYWIGDEVGSVCDYGGVDLLCPDDMVRITAYSISHDEYVEWRDANLDNHRYIDFKSWLMGARH